jgi:DNA recombination protein RmuC
MDYFSLAIFLIIGLILGAILTRAIINSRHTHATATLTERLRNSEQQLTETKEELKTKENQIEYLRSQHAIVKGKLETLDRDQNKMLDAFKALSAQALQNNNQSFLTLAQTRLEVFNEKAKNDLETRQQVITELIKPVQASLQSFDTKVQDLEKARIGAYEAIYHQIDTLKQTQHQLHAETANLVKALRMPTVRGRWGEIQLKRVVEMAGMVEHCDFTEQASLTTEEGRLRPDMQIHLPSQKLIFIDAKVPLQAYLEAIEATNDDIRKTKLRDHAKQVRNHLNNLGKKAYWSKQDVTPEFVVLFLPGEHFFHAALEQDPELIEAGVQENVIIATPTTLIALLKAVAYGWKQEKLAKNAQDIANLGQELYKRLSTMGDHWKAVGKGLTQAIDAYNKATGTLESRVLVQARRFKDLETTKIGEEIEPILQIERTARGIQAVEMLQDA